MGRRCKLTPTLQQTITGLLAEGHYIATVCRYVAIDERTFYRWLERGKPPQEGEVEDRATARRVAKFRQFRQSVEKAEADAQMAALTMVRRAMLDNWQAAAWYLERKFPDQFGRRVRQEISGPDGAPIPHRHSIMTTSAERLLETLDTDELIAYEKVAAKLAAAERSGELDLQGDARHQSPLPEEALPLLPPGLEPD